MLHASQHYKGEEGCDRSLRPFALTVFLMTAMKIEKIPQNLLAIGMKLIHLPKSEAKGACVSKGVSVHVFLIFVRYHIQGEKLVL